MKTLLLIAGAVLAIHLGPFNDGDAWQAVLTGMVLVSAMAIKNAAHRIDPATEPPSTLMTGTTTQIMIDLADMVQPPRPEARCVPGAPLAGMAVNMAVFAIGCATAALLYAHVGVRCFVVPPGAWRGGAVFACGRGAEVTPSASILVFDRTAADADR